MKKFKDDHSLFNELLHELNELKGGIKIIIGTAERRDQNIFFENVLATPHDIITKFFTNEEIKILTDNANSFYGLCVLFVENGELRKRDLKCVLNQEKNDLLHLKKHYYSSLSTKKKR